MINTSKLMAAFLWTQQQSDNTIDIGSHRIPQWSCRYQLLHKSTVCKIKLKPELTPTWFLKTFVFQTVAVFCVSDDNASFEWADWLTPSFHCDNNCLCLPEVASHFPVNSFSSLRISTFQFFLNLQCFDAGQLLRRQWGEADKDFSFSNLSSDSSDSCLFLVAFSAGNCNNQLYSRMQE